jgi:hypothetical protein
VAISVVSTTLANTTSITIPSTTAHNCLVVCISAFGNSQTSTGVTIGGSADHFAEAVSVGGVGTGPLCAIWVDRDCVGGQTAIACAGSLVVDSSDGGIAVYEVAGLDTASPLDLTQSGSGSGTSWSSGTTGTTSQASEIWVGVANTFGSSAGPSSPWVNHVNTGGFGISGTDIVSSTGAATYAGTSTSGAWAAAIATLKGLSVTAKPIKLNQAVMRSAVF